MQLLKIYNILIFQQIKCKQNWLDVYFMIIPESNVSFVKLTIILLIKIVVKRELLVQIVNLILQLFSLDQ